jgi:hypothetical protein
MCVKIKKRKKKGGSMTNDYKGRLLESGTEETTEDFDTKTDTDLQSDEYYELPLAIKSRTLIWSVISFALGILSLALCAFYYVGFAFALVALAMALVSRKNLGFFEKYSIMGLIFGIMGFVFSTFSLIVDLIGLF